MLETVERRVPLVAKDPGLRINKHPGVPAWPRKERDDRDQGEGGVEVRLNEAEPRDRASNKDVDLPAILKEGSEAGIDMNINIMFGLAGRVVSACPTKDIAIRAESNWGSLPKSSMPRRTLPAKVMCVNLS